MEKFRKRFTFLGIALLALSFILLITLFLPNKAQAQNRYSCAMIGAPPSCQVQVNNCAPCTLPPSPCPAGLQNCTGWYPCQCPANPLFGTVNRPPGVSSYGSIFTGGLTTFIQNILRMIIIIAGIYALINIVLASFSFMSAGGDSKKIADAWAKIWQTLIGLAVATGAFVIAAIIGWLLFRDYNALLRIRLFGP